MDIFLGVDGGGTKTEALACDRDGMILGRGAAGPSNPIFTKKDRAFANIFKAAGLALRDIEKSGSFTCRAAICVPGAKKFKGELEMRSKSFCEQAHIDSDERSSFLGALAEPYGIVVSSGTGSFAMGVNRAGDSCELGGWGPVLGDEGSGYHIGVLCLRAVIGEYEGFGPGTLLTPKIKEFLMLDDINELKRTAYSKDFDRSRMGSLSRLVHACALEGDAVSLAIIARAAHALADLALRTASRLKMDDGVYNAVLTGGVSRCGELMEKPFSEAVSEKNPRIRVKRPEFTPAVGSLLAAMLESGLDAFDCGILSNLRASGGRFYKEWTEGS